MGGRGPYGNGANHLEPPRTVPIESVALGQAADSRVISSWRALRAFVIPFVFRFLLEFTLYAQALILGAGGSIACLNNIFKEKERNSFDFQRITRLTSAELTVGKLFGAPALMYFVFACLMPLSLAAAALAHTGVSFYLAAKRGKVIHLPSFLGISHLPRMQLVLPYVRQSLVQSTRRDNPTG